MKAARSGIELVKRLLAASEALLAAYFHCHLIASEMEGVWSVLFRFPAPAPL